MFVKGRDRDSGYGYFLLGKLVFVIFLEFFRERRVFMCKWIFGKFLEVYNKSIFC